MGLPITSPDISNLDFAILYDISGATPAITLTNLSTVINAASLVWWYTIFTPSGTPIHIGSSTVPDVNHAPWATINVPGAWPTPFGTGICEQIQFSSGVPYVVTVYVKDSLNNTYQLAKNTVICRPNGNVQNSCGNFGQALIDVQVQCQNAVIYAQDKTIYAYQGSLTPSVVANTWTLVYPPDGNGNFPPNETATNVSYVNFPVGYAGDGYQIFMNAIATYNLGNGCSVKLQYKSIQNNKRSSFGVWCGIDLCKLSCAIQKLYEQTKNNCGELDSPEMDQKLNRATTLFTLLMGAIFQPLCDTDITKLRKELEKLLGTGDCCCATGINPMPTPSSGGACCPVFVAVVNVTASPVTSCQDTVFPVQVYDPTYTTIVGIATSTESLLYLLNSTPVWSAYGTAFSAGLCQIGFFPKSPGNPIPSVHVVDSSSSACVDNTQLYTLTLSDICYPTTPVTSASFPLNVFIDFGIGGGSVYVGSEASQSDMISALNALSTKPSSVLFSAGSSAGQIVVYNNSCSAYSGVITITCDIGSSSFLALGASHSLQTAISPAVINGGIEAYGLRLNSVLGKLPGISSSNIQWHTIKIANFLLVTESDTGRVYCFDISTPLYPVLVKTVQLTTVSGTSTPNFSGLPHSLGIAGATVASYYSLYFPTDFNIMPIGSVYVVEAVTGSIWNINMDPSSSAGVIASFHDDLMLGKCPRIIMNISSGGAPVPTMIFTQDGSLEQDAGLTSGVAAGDLVLLDLTTFNSGGLSVRTTSIPANTDYIWGATFDLANSIWFLGKNGTLMRGFISPGSAHLNFSGPNYSTLTLGLIRLNIKYYQGKLYCTNLQSNAVSPGIFTVDLTGLPLVPVVYFGICTANESAFYHPNNVLPLGNCLVLVTGEGGDTSYPTGQTKGAIMVYKTDGTFLMSCDWNAGQSVYNVVAIPGVTVDKPNGFV